MPKNQSPTNKNTEIDKLNGIYTEFFQITYIACIVLDLYTVGSLPKGIMVYISSSNTKDPKNPTIMKNSFIVTMKCRNFWSLSVGRTDVPLYHFNSAQTKTTPSYHFYFPVKIISKNCNILYQPESWADPDYPYHVTVLDLDKARLIGPLSLEMPCLEWNWLLLHYFQYSVETAKWLMR